MTSSFTGTFQIIIADSSGTVVLYRSLNESNDIETLSGVTNAEELETWAVTVNLTTFNGNGSYFLGEGN